MLRSIKQSSIVLGVLVADRQCISADGVAFEFAFSPVTNALLTSPTNMQAENAHRRENA